MAMCSFVPPLREAKLCCVPVCVFDKLGCASGEKKSAEHWSTVYFLFMVSVCTSGTTE
jgi:hypothetical protein